MTQRTTSTDRNATRRDFLRQAGFAAAAATVVPRHVLGGAGFVAPSERVNVAIIGAGGQGMTNMRRLFQLPDVRVMALADVMEQADYSRSSITGARPVACLPRPWPTSTTRRKTPTFLGARPMSISARC